MAIMFENTPYILTEWKKNNVYGAVANDDITDDLNNKIILSWKFWFGLAVEKYAINVITAEKESKKLGWKIKCGLNKIIAEAVIMTDAKEIVFL